MQVTFAYLMKEISDESKTREYPSIDPLQWPWIKSETEQSLYTHVVPTYM